MRDRILEYCNEDGKVQDKTKDYIVDRSRPSSYQEDHEYSQKLDALEQEQIAWIWVLIFAFATPELGQVSH